MSDTPHFGFYKHPRFSANHVAEYLCTLDAGQREAVIRKAKFPRKSAVVAYQQVTPVFRRFMTGNTSDLSFFDEPIQRLEAKARREVGYPRDEALRCIAAIEAFKIAFAKVDLGNAEFVPGPRDVTFKVEGVSINVRLDPPIIERTADGSNFSGGCVMLLSSSPEARRNIESRRKNVAAIAHWALEKIDSNQEPAAKLCLSFDAFGGKIISAPQAVERLRKRVAAACREAGDSWHRVEPPAGYDGPAWR
jgi:hypothetical protein